MHRIVVSILFVFFTAAPAAAELSIEAAIDQRQTSFKAMKGEVKKLKEAMSAKEPAEV